MSSGSDDDVAVAVTRIVAQRISLLVDSRRERVARFRLFHFDDKLEPVRALASIAGGQESAEWPLCILANPTLGTVDATGTTLEGLQLPAGSTRFSVTWLFPPHLNFTQMRLTPWIGE